MLLATASAGAGATEAGLAPPREQGANVFQLEDELGRAPGPTSPSPAAPLPDAAELWQRVAAAERRVAGLLDEAQDMWAVAEVFGLSCDAADPEGARAATYLAEAERRAEDPGLSLRGAYNYRGNEGGGGSGFVDNDRSDQDAYLELSWEILGNGYRQRETESDIFRRRAEITRLEARESRHRRDALCRRQELPAVFHGPRAGLLEQKLALVEPLYAANRRAYFRGGRLLEDVLELESEQAVMAETRTALARQAGAAAGGRAWSGVTPPLIELDVGAVVRAMAEDPTLARSGVLRRQVAREQSRINDLNRLRLFLRAEADDLQQSADVDMVAGLRFTVPLDEPDAPLLELRLREIDEATRLAAWERELELEEAVRAYQEYAGRARSRAYRVLRAHEGVRRALATRRLYPEDADLHSAMRGALDMVDAALEALAARLEVYRRVNEVLRRAGVAFDTAFVRVVSHRGAGYRARTGDRSLYAWSRAFNALDNAVIEEFLAAKGVSELLVSAGRRVSRDKLRRLLEASAARGVRVSLVLANNHWARPDRHHEAAARSVAAAELHPAVHLDVEPHVLPGFDDARAAYLDDYVEMLRGVREALPAGVRLTVAVPVFWDPEVYGRIAGLVDDLYLMAYETPEVDRVAARVAPIIAAVGRGKVVIVLRTRDFPDEAALEEAFDGLAAATGVHRFGIHKLGDYLRMAQERP